MPLNRTPEPFSDFDWLFEAKWDGFRCLAYIEHVRCRLVSRNGNEFKSVPALNVSLLLECRAKRAVLDGEIVCLDRKGNSQFRNLLFRRVNRASMHSIYSPAMARTCAILPSPNASTGCGEQWRMRLSDCFTAITSRSVGKHLFRLACKRDLEGIVAKRKFDPYLLDNAKWYKIRNRNYSQWVGREKLFERERSTDPNWHHWNVCASASDQLVES